MHLEPLRSTEPRDVLRALRDALGAGPAVALGAPETDAAPRGVPPGTAVVVSTSGSSGVPKRIVLTRHALTTSALATRERIGSGRWLLALPATYIAGVQVIVRSLIEGEEPTILAGKFSAEAFAHVARGMRSIRGATSVPMFTSLVPAQLDTLVLAAERDAATAEALRRFETILVGGQALSPDLRERADQVGARVVRTYGSSETAGGCVYDGVPLGGVGVREIGGELQLSGPMLAAEYLDDEQRTRDAFIVDADGTRWYRTGDTGTFTGGVVCVTGRADNVIISGGINVSLDRVERLVRKEDRTDQLVVVPADDARWGQVPAIVAVSGALSDERISGIRARLERDIGVAARPAAVIEVDAIPTLPSGKPDRSALTRLVQQALDEPGDASAARVRWWHGL